MDIEYKYVSLSPKNWQAQKLEHSKNECKIANECDVTLELYRNWFMHEFLNTPHF